jgi:hypothetical protein
MKFNVPTEGVINCGKNERHFKVAENLEALIFKKNYKLLVYQGCLLVFKKKHYIQLPTTM